MRRIAVALLLLAGLAAGPRVQALTLSGRVVDDVSAGVYPLDIDVHDSATGLLVPTPGDTTDALGFYAITLPAGVYDVAFVPFAGSHLFTRTFKSQNLVTNTTLNVALARGRYLTGRVTDTDGLGVFMADLDFHDPATGDIPANVQGDTSDGSGNFTALVDAGLWDVSVIAPPAARRVPRLFPGMDLTADRNLGTVALEAGRLVQGTVTDLGFFPILDADLDVRPAGERAKLFTPQDNTAADGSYQLMLPPGLYDISANPPPGQPYASATARSVLVGASDVVVPNLALPPGVELRGRCRDTGGNPVAGVDVDVDSLPYLLRLETPGDVSDAAGNFRPLVSTWKFRVTLSPPVATRLLPVRFDSLQITGARDLGNITFASGHWVSGTVVGAGGGQPIAGANLDFIRKSTGLPAITPGDRTDAAGAFRVTTDGDLYRLRVIPPDATHDTLELDPFGSLNDTTVTLVMAPGTVGVSGPRPGAGLVLGAPWPNPASTSTAVGFQAAQGEVELSVWDVAGRRVATLFRGAAPAARVASWNGHDAAGHPAPPGVYYLRLSNGAAFAARRLVLLR